MIELDNTKQEKGVVAPFLIYTGLAVTGILLSQFAFTRKVREQIWERDGGQCQVCGTPNNLQCAHYDHNRDNPWYNDPENGRLLCWKHHLEEHIDNAGQNGLLPHQNDYAIKMLKQRMDPD